MSPSALLIARLSGLPASTMDGFSTGLGELLDEIAEREAALSDVRSQLVDHLHTAIHNAPSVRRHALLAVKRDCFNGRPLSRHVGKSGWKFVEEAAPELALRAVAMEQELDQRKRDFARQHEDESVTQYDRLAELASNPMFRCGLAVGSSSVAGEAGRLQAANSRNYGRREKRLATTLLRYASRASVKLSPFSTFTPVGICRVETGGQPLRLLAGEWDRCSLVRVRRHILDRCVDLLCLYEPWRRTLPVALNDSVAKLADGRTLHRRPSLYKLDEERTELRFLRESLVRARLQGTLVDKLLSLLATGAVPYADLLTALSDATDSSNSMQIREDLDHLIDLGFLYLAPPWSSDDGHLEKKILQECRRLPHDPALQMLIEHLEQLVRLGETLLQAKEPVQAMPEMQRAMDGILESAARLAGLPDGVKMPMLAPGRDIYQDVWCSPKDDVSKPVVSIGKTQLELAHRSVEPLLRYSRLFDHRLELMFSMGSLLQERRGRGCKLEVLSAFDAVQDLFQNYISFSAQIKTIAEQYVTWNPLGLPVIQRLQEVRASVREALNHCLIDDEQGRTVSMTHLNLLLTATPQEFNRPQGGACLFLQPATADGSLWVLNRLKEGTGRMSSRYTPLMPAALRYQFAGELARRAAVVDGNERVQILDIHCVAGDTLNVHVPQTPKVLVLPATKIDIPPEQKLTLAELFVTIDETGWPSLGDLQGNRYMASYLGLAGSTYLPTLVKFLCAFGPTDTIAFYPDRLERELGGVTVRERTRIGNVVLARKSWKVPLEDLRTILENPGSPEAFERLDRFLRKHGIPSRVFVAEQLNMFPRGKFHKPQYLDLTSPLFIAILHSVVLAAEEPVVLVEALPGPEDMPKDLQGERWALELLVDAVALQPPVNNEASLGARSEVDGAQASPSSPSWHADQHVARPQSVIL